MRDILGQNITISDRAVSSTVGNEAVLLHLDHGTYYSLDEVGALLWQKLKDGLPAREIPAHIVDNYDTDEEIAARDVRAVLEDLKQRELIRCDDE